MTAWRRAPLLPHVATWRTALRTVAVSAESRVQVPVTLVYNTRAVDRSGPAALHLDAYGAYEMCNDPSFSRPRVSLLDRGVVYAIAHVRGGGDLGREWYENGKFLKKKNTFYDTIAAAEHLVAEGWTTATQMTLEGRSAGGMTVGAVANMRPDLFTVRATSVCALQRCASTVGAALTRGTPRCRALWRACPLWTA